MKIPLSWVREFVDFEEDLARLAKDLTLVGLAVDGVLISGGETILDLDITTNRVDCMNVYGVAREIAVLYGRPLRPLEVGFSESGEPASASLSVSVEAEHLCPRFCGRVLDVVVQASPDWIVRRLEAAGVRSISNVVDLSNYVMLEMGQPSHAFDLAKVPEGRLAVRWAREGEQVKTLDGVERKLHEGTGIVAGALGPLGLAGIMGGASSEVSETTRAIILEAANWEPLAIRRAARSLGMHTEASHRFERSADPEAPPLALARFAHLLQKISGGSARPGLVDCRPSPKAQRVVRLRQARAEAVLGTRLEEGECRRILEGLGFLLGPGQGGETSVTLPSWRADVTREIDVIEEIARHHGLDKIESTFPRSSLAGALRPWQARERALGDALAAAGFDEAVHYAFVSEKEAAWVEGPRVALANPLSEEQSVLRNSLVVPGLIGALRANESQGRRDVALFEIGRVFLPTAGPPKEERRAGVLWAGRARLAHWSERARDVDFFDVKGLLEVVLGRLGAGDLEWTAEGAPPFLHPGQAALVKRKGRPLGYAGRVHPDVIGAFALRGSPVVAELLVEELLHEEPKAERVHSLDRFPPVPRDLSVLVDEKLAARELLAKVSGVGAPLLRSASVVDRYLGPPVALGKVSLTLALVFQDPERTLTGEEVQEAVDRIVVAIQSLGGEIRRES